MSKSLVIDTNLIFSSLLPHESRIRDVLLDDDFTLYAPNYIISEIFHHQRKLLKYTKLNDVEFFAFFNSIIERVKFIPLDVISTQSRQKAYDLCKDIDPKDTPFVALSIELNILLWTGDKKLKTGLKAKGFDGFYEFI
ncbi:MAG: PIN domain-containing protein [Spirosomaceae bacterium]|nr:PIN domain-containing protein [Spirosomataceae bacterium]